jgi:hypothetical protein
MERFAVDGSAMYRRFWGDTPNRLEDTSGQLARRYGLSGKRVLSIGGGAGAREHFLIEAGNAATVVEPDRKGNLRKFFQEAPCGSLQYIVADPGEVDEVEPFDVLLSSGFGTDETRRGAIIRQRGTPCFQRMITEVGAWDWPWWEDPFHPTLMRFAARLPRDALMIVESCSAGLDVHDYRCFLPACDRQLMQNGLQLVEFYRFAKTVGIMLFVIAKGSPTLPLREPLTSFNGRAEFEPIECLRAAA